ncbi:DEAD/DEAH box helicase family protein [Bradyrhizobium manausense]|uniref:DEAD/DEAH box helicase n=1 Tax=Bradyrhizobium manausense TaxID=989370 RepID=UPI001BA586B9|nr:DEAD/DEAH box helicase family protein [Bradyrhizobium manausense]MBR0827361.1 DEAD/DEAH box helicase family protein [Bradyrhizobium manausense]
MELKDYQKETLASLARFFRAARVSGPKVAYETMVNEPAQKARLGRYASTYRPLEAVPLAPYVCLRLPTGGGKTLLATRAVSIVRDSWIEKDYPLVLWLVPTNTIRLQTVDALKNPRHAYRQSLDEAFEGRVRVFDIADFSMIRPQDLREQACIVVGTIQTLRVSNTEGRKVYAHHEDLESHFSTVPPNAPDLERSEDGANVGRIKFSFANLMHLHRPLMIVDEAHNAMTGLSREMQARVNPCAIVEFTATPHLNSNILHNVTAQELKREEMIKLPIVLTEHADWQSAVSGAVATRAALAEKALLDTAGYIRPIVLFQAQPRDEDVTVEVLKKHLVETENIHEDRIAVATGDQRELDAIDLFDPRTKIEYIITVEALKEGWDCSFAYVFCSVSKIRSATAVEQLLGRVLRMPYAKRRASSELNKAYAHIAEPVFTEAAKSLVDRLVDMGFDDSEARENIENPQFELDSDGLFAPRARPAPVFRQTFSVTPETMEALHREAGDAVVVRAIENGNVEIAVTGYLAPEVEAAILKAAPEEVRTQVSEAAIRYRAEVHPNLSPAERGVSFVAPALTAWVQDEFVFAETDRFMEEFEWSLLDAPAALTESEFSVRQSQMEFEIDLDGKKLAYSFVNEQDRLALDTPVEGWDAINLSVWLDRQVRQIYVPPSELLRWLRDAINHLVSIRGIPISALWRAKYPLAQKLESKIKSLRYEAQSRAYQLCLFSPEARTGVSFEEGFKFFKDMYFDVRKHRGGAFKFRNHFLGSDNVPAFSGKEGDTGEEFMCAQMLDSLNDKVEFWIRNVALHVNSFRLPLAGGFFYPDFVAKLKDGRIFVVEYKGEHLAGAGNDDTNEKRLVGALWEKASAGKGLFAMIEKDISGRDPRRQLIDKIEGR